MTNSTEEKATEKPPQTVLKEVPIEEALEMSQEAYQKALKYVMSAYENLCDRAGVNEATKSNMLASFVALVSSAVQYGKMATVRSVCKDFPEMRESLGTIQVVTPVEPLTVLNPQEMNGSKLDA